MQAKILLLFLLFQAGLLFGQSTDFRFTNYTVRDGISSNSVRCVLKDSRGFLWIGTGSGLNLFDGHSFKIFLHNRFDSLSLPGNTINSIAEDGNGRLWIGTDNGVAHFNPQNGKSENFTHHADDSFSLPADYGNHTFIDHEKRIWIFNFSGVALFDRKTKTFHQLNKDPFSVTSITEENSNSFWMGTYNGLFHLNLSSGSWEKYLPYPSDSNQNLVLCELIDHSGKIMCGVWGGGLCILDREQNRFNCYRWIQHPENPSTVNVVSALTEIEDENHRHQLLAGTGQGLMVIDNDHFPQSIENVPHLRHDASKPESIAGDFVRSLLVDNEKTIWIGTDDGLSAVLPSQQIFQKLDDGLQGQVMRILPVDSLLFITCWYGNGLTICDNHFRVKKSYARLPLNSTSLDNGQISDVIRDENGMLWLATFNGLVKLNPSGNQSEIFLHNQKDSSSISDNRVTSLQEDGHHTLWVGTYNGGLNRFDPATRKFTHFHHQDDSTSIPNDQIWLIRKDHAGTIWIGTNGGLCSYNEQKNDFVDFQQQVQGAVYDIFEDTGHNLWIGTSQGLYQLNADRNLAGYYSIEDGLASNDVSGIIEDDEGNLWLGTPAGLSRFKPQEKFFTNYSVKNGLPDLPYQSVFFKNADGIIYQGATNAFLVFDPKKLNKPAAAPPVYLTGLRVNNSPVSLDAAQWLHFPHDENTLMISFTAPDFNKPALIHYLIKMDGNDNEWRDQGNSNTVTYASLAPGNYLFHVKARNADGAVSSADAQFHFVIAPPFWKMWWFLTLLALAVAALFFFVVRYVTTRRLREQLLILEKEKAVETERTRIARDMHDDLGSGLTKIAILSEVTRRQLKQPEKATQQLHTISDSARTLVDNLNEIIWTLNPQHDNLDSLMAYIRVYATQYFEGMETSVVFDYPAVIPSIHLSDQQRRNIILVLKESLNNISKHAQASRVQVALTLAAGRFQITVSDNGKGFNTRHPRAGGNGLTNMTQRMKTIGGEYSITSSEGNGTVTTLVLKV